MRMRRNKKNPASQGHLKVLERLKNEKHIEELLNGLERIMVLDNLPLRQLILDSGLPDSSQAFKYLQYNQQVKHEPDRTLRLSLVVVFNNRQVDRFRLRGIKRALSQKLFAFSKNRMDFFINSLRCEEGMMSLMAEAPHNFSLLGILQIACGGTQTVPQAAPPRDPAGGAHSGCQPHRPQTDNHL